MRPTLSPKHALFVRHYRKTGIARRAYLAAGYRPTNQNSLDACASRLLSSAKIQARIRELDSQMTQRTRITIESLLKDLAEDRALARETKQVSAAIAATQLSAKLVGLLVDRKESGAPGDFAGLHSEEEIFAALREQLGDETAETLIAALNKAETQREEIEQPPAPAAKPIVVEGNDTVN